MSWSRFIEEGGETPEIWEAFLLLKCEDGKHRLLIISFEEKKMYIGDVEVLKVDELDEYAYYQNMPFIIALGEDDVLVKVLKVRVVDTRILKSLRKCKIVNGDIYYDDP